MTIFLNIDAPPKPSDIELEAMDHQAWGWAGHAGEQMSFPDFCTICLDLHEGEPTRNDFLRWVEAKCNRVEARGEAIEYPLRMTRWAWYVEWNAFDAQDERNTLNDAGNAGTW